MTTNPIKVWRNVRKLSQEELADLIGVKAMTVSRWERGEHLPRKKQWPTIEAVTGIPASEIVSHVKQPEVAQ